MMRVSQPLFLGFGHLEDLANETTYPDKTVFITPFADTVDLSGTTTETHYVEVQACILEGVVGYWRFEVGNQRAHTGFPFDPVLSGMFHQTGAELFTIIKDWFSERGFRTIQSKLASPRDYVWMKGHASFFKWDGESRKWVRVAKDTPAPEPAPPAAPTPASEEPPPLYGGRHA